MRCESHWSSDIASYSWRRLSLRQGPGDAGAAWIRYQQATERCAQLATAIALDASERLRVALADDGPGAKPITSLRELHALWVECGEAAYSRAAHREEFAAAQAELLSALVELRAGVQPR